MWFCLMTISLWGRPRTHNISKSPPLVAMCWLQGVIALAIQALGVPLEVLWIHSLGGSIVGGSDTVGLEWGARTCGVIP